MITLREITKSDLEKINKWRNDPEIIANLGSNFRYVNYETDLAWFENYLANRHKQVILAIEQPDSPPNSPPIGMVYLNNICHLNRTAEFAIQIGDKHKQNQGAGTQATLQCLSHAFNNLNLNRIYLYVLENNQPALALYKKVGFKVEGTLRQAIYKQGDYRNMIIMSILKGEFNGS